MPGLRSLHVTDAASGSQRTTAMDRACITHNTCLRRRLANRPMPSSPLPQAPPLHWFILKPCRGLSLVRDPGIGSERSLFRCEDWHRFWYDPHCSCGRGSRQLSPHQLRRPGWELAGLVSAARGCPGRNAPLRMERLAGAGAGGLDHRSLSEALFEGRRSRDSHQNREPVF